MNKSNMYVFPLVSLHMAYENSAREKDWTPPHPQHTVHKNLNWTRKRFEAGELKATDIFKLE